jgi:L-Ala-D/L-Glu epimerase
MVITSIHISPLNLPLNEPFSIATGAQSEVRNVLLEIRLQNGISGLGEAAPFPAVSGETQEGCIAALEQVVSHLVYSDIRQWKKIAEEITELIPGEHAAQCAIHMALLDAFTKACGISVASFMGGSSDTLLTDMTITAGDVDHAGASALSIVQRGISTIKIKTAGKDVSLDFARIARVHEKAPDVKITVDGNCGYTLDGANQLSKELMKAGIPILFFEQPFPREQWENMAEFSRTSGMKIAADESARTSEDILRIVKDRSAQVINIKLMKSGFVEAVRMMEIARGAGLELMIGGMVETILSMSFSAHVAAGFGGFSYADLDTPLFIPEHPFKGGFTLQGDKITVDFSESGHGVSLRT